MYQCYICKCYYLTLNKLKPHLENCLVHFENEGKIKNHILSSWKYGAYNIGSIKNSNKKLIYVSEDNETYLLETISIVCYICNKTFTNIDNVRSHLLTHTFFESNPQEEQLQGYNVIDLTEQFFDTIDLSDESETYINTKNISQKSNKKLYNMLDNAIRKNECNQSEAKTFDSLINKPNSNLRKEQQCNMLKNNTVSSYVIKFDRSKKNLDVFSIANIDQASINFDKKTNLSEINFRDRSMTLYNKNYNSLQKMDVIDLTNDRLENNVNVFNTQGQCCQSNKEQTDISTGAFVDLSDVNDDINHSKTQHINESKMGDFQIENLSLKDRIEYLHTKQSRVSQNKTHKTTVNFHKSPPQFGENLINPSDVSMRNINKLSVNANNNQSKKDTTGVLYQKDRFFQNSECTNEYNNAIKEDQCILIECSDNENNSIENEQYDQIIFNSENKYHESASEKNNETTISTKENEYFLIESSEEEEIAQEAYKNKILVNLSNNHTSLSKNNNNNCNNSFTFVCYICNDIFTNISVLRKHLSNHILYSSGNKKALIISDITKPIKHSKKVDHQKYQCKSCPKIYTKSHHYKAHLIIHNSPQPEYKCNVCTKVFQTHARLNQHKIIHSDEKPFHCHKCTKSFRRKAELKTHFRTHYIGKVEKTVATSKTAYGCVICMKMFLFLKELVAHQTIHHKET